MEVVIAGGHGQIALRLTRILSEREDRVTGLIRNPVHAGEIEHAGGRALVCDLETASAGELAELIRGADAIVFAAGAGPGSGAERKLTVDRDGAVKALDAATVAGVPRYVMISATGAESPPDGDGVFDVYLRAKAEADAAVAASDRDWTILRPGALTDAPGSGLVRLQTAPFRGDVTRDDVASVIAALLLEPRSSGTILYLNSGTGTISEQLDAALSTSDGTTPPS